MPKNKGFRAKQEPSLEEVMQIVQRARSKEIESEVCGREAIAFKTIRYYDIEFIVSVSFTTCTSICCPSLYIDGEIQHDGIHVRHRQLASNEDQDIFMKLARQAPLDSIEELLHFAHPQLVNPHFQGDDWHYWKFAGIGSDEISKRETELAKRTINAVLPYLKDNQHIAVLGCGAGPEVILLRRAIQELQLEGITITAFDLSQELLYVAEKMMSDKEASPKVIFKQQNLVTLAEKYKKRSFDIALALGLFDMQTLDWNTGIKILDQVRYVLADSGIGVFTASSGCRLFNSNHYNQRGFRVIQCAMPHQFYTEDILPQPYVVSCDPRKMTKNINNQLYSESEQWKQYPELAKPFMALSGPVRR